MERNETIFCVNVCGCFELCGGEGGRKRIVAYERAVASSQIFIYP